MAFAVVESVASFSVVLTETFAAVGLSSLVPATFEALLRASRGAQGDATGTRSIGNMQDVIDHISGGNATIGAPARVVDSLADAAFEITNVLKSVDLLVPDRATIDASFEFHGAESYGANAKLGARVEVVTVDVGYSALYSVKSSNKIKLHVAFEKRFVDLTD